MKKWIFLVIMGCMWISLNCGLEAGNKGKKISKGLPPTAEQIIHSNLLNPEPAKSKVNEPSDLLNLIPFVREINQMIPRQFSIVNHEFKLDPSQVVIQHHFFDERTKRTPKNSIISLSYYGDLGKQFETQVDVPLFYSPLIGLTDWSRYPMGNYTMTINQTRSLEDRVYIRAQTRF